MYASVIPAPSSPGQLWGQALNKVFMWDVAIISMVSLLGPERG